MRLVNPDALEEQTVSPEGEVCTIKDCCVAICSGGIVRNAPRLYTDRAKLTAAYDAVRGAVESIHGWTFAEAVHRTLWKLPVKYNARLTRAIGRAKFANDKGSAIPTEIELTAAYQIPEGYMHRLLVHEGCHVARAVIEPVRFNYENPHGLEWKQLMVGAGQTPEATCIDPELNKIALEKARERRGHPAPADVLDRSQVNVGDRISFMGPRKQGRVAGVVTQKTEKAAMIRDDNGGSWRVGYALLVKG